MKVAFTSVDKYISEKSVSGLSNEQYIEMCAQMGVEPDPAKLMTKFPDLPLVIQKALMVYGKLNDNYVSLGMEGSVFNGKDFTGVPAMLELYSITDDREKEITLAVIEHVNKNEVDKAHAARKKKS